MDMLKVGSAGCGDSIVTIFYYLTDFAGNRAMNIGNRGLVDKRIPGADFE
jgi:hypothetical protein